MWTRILAAALGAALWLGALAGEWRVGEIPCCYVVYPTPDESPLAKVQEIYQAVTGLWLPPGVSLGELAAQWRANISPQLLPPSPERALVVLYDDLEEYWRDVNYFGVEGLFYYAVPDGVLEGPLGEFAQREPAATVLGCVTACCLYRPWEATLAHELTHMIQNLVGFEVPELGLDPDLLLEGMARWTEYALGYRGSTEWKLAREMAAIWVREVDDLSTAPLFVAYELGATLVGKLAERLPPPAILGLFSWGPKATGGASREGFLVAFREAYGEGWDAFLRGWLAGLRTAEISREGELLYEFRRKSIMLRASFLWPLLSPGEREEFLQLKEAFYNGTASEKELQWAEETLANAWAEPTDGILSALERRQGSLKYWVRIISGPAASAEVTRLNIVRLSSSPEEYVRAFVDLVNTYLVFRVPAAQAGGAPRP
ncbi:MAG: hypothetical protein GXO72_00790 [Caldiserica bacterium]|nr:hypothetical protein [Caldisericota bacterium]